MTCSGEALFPIIDANKNSISHRKIMFGVGINDAPYQTRPTVNGKQVTCYYYRIWTGLLQRCYSLNFQKSHPTYTGCSVTAEWHSFMNFRKWMKAQDWEGKHLDKDIQYPGNKMYGPKTCLFISRKINNLFIKSETFRGDCPPGVHLDKVRNLFIASINLFGKRKTIGRYSSKKAASAAYRKAKRSHVLRIACCESDIRVKQGLYRHSELLR